MTDKPYTPSEARVCIDFCNAATKRIRPDGSFMSMDEAEAAFSRFIEDVRQKEHERCAQIADRMHGVGNAGDHESFSGQSWGTEKGDDRDHR